MEIKPLEGSFSVVSHKTIEKSLAASGLPLHLQYEIRLLFRSWLNRGYATLSTQRITYMYGDYARKQIRRFMKDCGYIVEIKLDGGVSFQPGRKCKQYIFDLEGCTSQGKPCPRDDAIPLLPSPDDGPLVLIERGLCRQSEIPEDFMVERAKKWADCCRHFGWDLKIDFEGKTSWGKAVLESIKRVDFPAVSKDFIRALGDDIVKTNWWCSFYSRIMEGVSPVVARIRGRCYHALTSCPRPIRALMTVEFRGDTERMVNVDMSSTYTAIMVGLMPEGAERDELIQILQSKTFYETLNAELPEDQQFTDRQELKKQYQKQCFFWRDHRLESRPLWVALKKRFPELCYTILGKRFRLGASGLSDFLMDRESWMFIDQVMVECNAQEIPCIPIHDALLVPESVAEQVRGMLERVAREFLGFTPAFGMS